jgi:hypothetical protein
MTIHVVSAAAWPCTAEPGGLGVVNTHRRFRGRGKAVEYSLRDGGIGLGKFVDDAICFE